MKHHIQNLTQPRSRLSSSKWHPTDLNSCRSTIATCSHLRLVVGAAVFLLWRSTYLAPAKLATLRQWKEVVLRFLMFLLKFCSAQLIFCSLVYAVSWSLWKKRWHPGKRPHRRAALFSKSNTYACLAKRHLWNIRWASSSEAKKICHETPPWLLTSLSWRKILIVPCSPKPLPQEFWMVQYFVLSSSNATQIFERPLIQSAQTSLRPLARYFGLFNWHGII